MNDFYKNLILKFLNYFRTNKNKKNGTILREREKHEKQKNQTQIKYKFKKGLLRPLGMIKNKIFKIKKLNFFLIFF